MARAQSYATHCNTTYARQFAEKGQSLPGPEPTQKIAIITCMDARLNVFDMFGLSLGEAHVIRTGGGRTGTEVVRSLVGSEQVLGTEEIMVVHHTDCGYSRAATLDALHLELDSHLQTPTAHIPMMPILNIDGTPPSKLNPSSPSLADKSLEQSVKDDVKFLEDCPYVMMKGGKKKPKLSGWIYGTFEGSIRQIC